MKKYVFLIYFSLIGILGLAQTEVVMNVGSTARQELKGVGASLTDHITTIPDATRKTMSDMVFKDMNMNILRMWREDDANFYTNFVNSNAISYAQQGGVTTLLLAPGSGVNPPSDMTAYANDIANFTNKLKTEKGIQLNVTGVANEPDNWTSANIADAITKIRTALNANGNSTMKIVAPESSNCDDHWYDIMVGVKNSYGSAWNTLNGIASHSYNMCATEKWAQFAFTNNKEYWMTEASANGLDSPTNDNEATSLTGRFLNDMNHGVSNWIYFIAYSSDTNDSLTKFMVYDTSTGQIIVFCKYYYMKQLFTTFKKGAIFRHVLANGSGEMNQTDSYKSPYNAAAAKNPDGSWNLSGVNGTGIQGYTAQSYKFTFDVSELTGAGNVPFTVLRTNVTKKIVNEGTVTMVNGRVSIVVGPKEVVTLISGTTAESKLNGNIIGTGGSGTGGATMDKVFDGNFTTFYDAVPANGAWVGLDLGSAKVISKVKFAPRVSWASRMNGGKIQGSNVADFGTSTDLYSITSNPVENTLSVGTVTNNSAFRYVRYLSPNGGYCNISELEFWSGTTSIAVTGVSLAPTSVSVIVGATATLTATVAPSNATNKTVSWSSNNTSVATVNSSGVVTGIAAGLATITVTTQDGSKTATCAVTITSLESKLTGTTIGTGGSGTSGATMDKVFDGNFTTFYDAVPANGAWVGLDLGSAKVISKVKFAPRASWASRMNGGIFQGSNVSNFGTSVNLYTIASNPVENTLTVGTVSNSTAFRYVRYLSPNNGYCNISELEFWGNSGAQNAPKLSTSTITIKDSEGMNATVYPNPLVMGDISIKLTGYENERTVSILMCDLVGKVVFMKNLRQEDLTNQPFIIQRSGLKSGVYSISVVANGCIKNLRLVIQ
ncbi:MAG: T9SS type A sorting domain-containing protein [Paludibacter sp.]|nr:T9SS type A sorting domain-containing protein [Paludibacter sp.]